MKSNNDDKHGHGQEKRRPTTLSLGEQVNNISLQRGPQLKMGKTIVAVFPRGSKKRKSNNDDKHGHGQEKRRLTTLRLGKKSNESA